MYAVVLLGNGFSKESCISCVYLLSVRFYKVCFVLAMTSGTALLAIRFSLRTSGVLHFWEVIDGT